ncbi:transposase [Streptomyces albidoflavus]|uniref:transposase n=1 Tax=Streptomyces albidoflavus TaxID=1886 RepID=UPI0015A65AF4
MPDALWSLVEPLLPEPGPEQVEGRPRVPDRQALCGVLFVPHTGVQWEHPPQELGFDSGMTGWRRLAGRNEAGVWGALHLVLPTKLRAPKKLDRSREVTDSLSRPDRSARVQKRPQPGRPGTASEAGQGDPVRPRCSFRQPATVANGWWLMAGGSTPTSRPLRLASGGAQRRAPPRDEWLSGAAPRRCADRRSQPWTPA